MSEKFLRAAKLLLTKFLVNEKFCENDVAISFRMRTTTNRLIVRGDSQDVRVADPRSADHLRMASQ
jgi:hypothetical protein